MLFRILFIGFFFGILGTTIGGIIGVLLKIKSKKVLSFILEFAAGLMFAVVTFDLLPESIMFSNIPWTLLFFIIGIIITMIIEEKINKINKGTNQKDAKYSLLKTGVLIGIGLALHNFPEGLAIRVWLFCK